MLLFYFYFFCVVDYKTDQYRWSVTSIVIMHRDELYTYLSRSELFDECVRVGFHDGKLLYIC